MRKFYLSLGALMIVLSGVLLLTVFNGKSEAATGARDCDANAIIHCGATSTGELTQRYNENKTGDLPTIYSSYGISKETTYLKLNYTHLKECTTTYYTTKPYI